jgi:glycosyltransferase involved in cell wall biosynthesis
MNPARQVYLLSPFHGGSHASWAEGYVQHSAHAVKVFSLPGRHWKWRMHGAAIPLARQLATFPRPDGLLATDMLDLASLRALLPPHWREVPMALYFHENQLTYPWSPQDADPAQQRDHHYGFINYRSALAADAVWFNSTYHQQSFFAALRTLLQRLPDYRELDLANQLAAGSRVMPLGLSLPAARSERPVGQPPLLLWNHRWEYDKAPEAFFDAMLALAEGEYPFELAVLGQSYGRKPPIFAKAQERLGARVRHWGYVADRAEYWRWLHRADLLPVTAVHDFFGASTVEAMAAGVYPLLPQRLAYPEHVPASLQAAHLYAEQADFLPRLQAWLAAPLRAEATLRDHVRRYAWSVVAPQYDAALENLVEEKKKS